MQNIKFSLLTYPNKTKSTPKFYIQTKGLHSGRPLRNSIKNCVAVYTDSDTLFDLVYLLFKGRKFERFIIGSIVPFIRNGDLIEVITEGVAHNTNEKEKYLIQNASIDLYVQSCKDKIKLLQSLQIALCHEFLK